MGTVPYSRSRQQKVGQLKNTHALALPLPLQTTLMEKSNGCAVWQTIESPIIKTLPEVVEVNNKPNDRRKYVETSMVKQSQISTSQHVYPGLNLSAVLVMASEAASRHMAHT